MTPLAAGPNRDAGTVPYAEKKPLYERSEFVVTRRIATENDDWTAERIAARQRWLATQATAIWRAAEIG